MPSVFLSHNSKDKPFVSKLANDLKRLGVDVWYDKWEIKVGESLTWKIEEGIREHEFLLIVLSPDSVKSEWVRCELGAAWSRQMKQRRVSVLPLLLVDCEIPLILADRKFADFRVDYQSGLSEIAAALNISELATIGEDNWRRFANSRSGNWQTYREDEFKILVTKLTERSREFNWSIWTGSSKWPYAITLHCSHFPKKRESTSISIRLFPKTHAYMASHRDEIHPNGIPLSAFDTYVGNSVNECEEYCWRRMLDQRQQHGDPTEKPFFHVSKPGLMRNSNKIAEVVMKEMYWYQGNNFSNL